jgi:hypothetical protein
MDVSNVIYLRITRVESARGVSAPCAVPERENLKMLGGAARLSELKPLQTNS